MWFSLTVTPSNLSPVWETRSCSLIMTQGEILSSTELGSGLQSSHALIKMQLKWHSI